MWLARVGDADPMTSKGYFDRPVGELRAQVRETMRAVALDRELSSTLDNDGYVNLQGETVRHFMDLGAGHGR